MSEFNDDPTTRAKVEAWFYQHATQDEARDASTVPILLAGFAIGVGIGVVCIGIAWLLLEVAYGG